MNRTPAMFIGALLLAAVFAGSLAQAQETFATHLPFIGNIPRVESNLELVHDLQVLQGEGGLADSVAVAKRVAHWQAASTGHFLPDTVLTPDHALPSEAALALTAQYGMSLTDADLANLHGLDQLEAPVRDALTAMLDGFLAMDDATRAAYADMDPAALEAALATAEAGEAPALEELDLGGVMAARNQFLGRALALTQAWGLRSQSTAASPGVNLCPALALDLDGVDTEYADHCALVLDVGGADTYLNNAGGSNIRGAQSCPVGGTAALMDLSGDDQYISGGNCGTNGGGYGGTGFLFDQFGNDTYTAGDNGTNGGGYVGMGFLFDQAGKDIYTAGDNGTNGGGGLGGVAASGLGFLLDRSGDDTYNAGNAGTNGGGDSYGTGFLLDQAGDDIYTAGNGGTNGGGGPGCIGCFGGSGFLFDRSGNDTYTAGDYGTNGGGGGYASGVGLLFDQSGDDIYTAGDRGTNGGSNGLSTGFLIDPSGNDTYTAGNYGTNGGGVNGGGRGSLLDQSGDDTYTAGDYGTNGGGYSGTGFLFDQSGDDTYIAGGYGTNGGGDNSGIGFLLDQAGDDKYTADNYGANGGGRRSVPNNFYGVGFLFDQAGNDFYHASGSTATNGGGDGDGFLLGVGLLLDTSGTDGYKIGNGPVVIDQTGVKGTYGAQVDIQTPAQLPGGTILKAKQASDGSITIYMDLDGDDQIDAGEEIAATPPLNYKLHDNGANSYTLYLDGDDDSEVDGGEGIQTTPPLLPALRQDGDGSVHLYNDANANGEENPDESIASSPGASRSGSTDEETLFSRHGITIAGRELPPEDLLGQEVPDYPGQNVPDYGGEEVDDHEGTAPIQTDPIAHAVGTLTTRDDGNNYCLYITPEGGLEQELACIGHDFLQRVENIQPLPRQDKELVFYDPPDIPATPPVTTPDVPPVTTPDAPPVTTPDVPETPTGSLGSTPEYSMDVDVTYSFDGARLAQAVSLLGQQTWSPIGLSQEDALWLALHGDQAALTVTVVVYEDGVEVDTIEHSVPLLGQAIAAAVASGSL